MSVIAAVIILAANLSDPSDPNILASTETPEAEMVLEEYMDGDLQNEEIVLDDTLLIDAESEMQEFEE